MEKPPNPQVVVEGGGCTYTPSDPMVPRPSVSAKGALTFRARDTLTRCDSTPPAQGVDRSRTAPDNHKEFI